MMMNLPTNMGDCLLYSNCFDEASNAGGICHGGRLPYGGPQTSLAGGVEHLAAVASPCGEARYESVETGDHLCEPRSRCRHQLCRRRDAATDHRPGVATCFASSADLFHSGRNATRATWDGDYCGFLTSRLDFGAGDGVTSSDQQTPLDCEGGRLLVQSSMVFDGVPLQPRRQLYTQHHPQHQQQLLRPTTYKWMTIKRGPPKTAGESVN